MIHRLRLWLWERRMRKLLEWHDDRRVWSRGRDVLALEFIEREIREHEARRPKR